MTALSAPGTGDSGSDTPTDRIGQFIRSTHPYGFRVGQWGRVLGVVAGGPNGHPCYQVGFDDEVCDLWVIDDPSDHYEFEEHGLAC